MGFTGGLLRSIFSGNNATENLSLKKTRWSSVRSYFCGNESNSIIKEEDSASVLSYEATQRVSQPPDSVLAVEDSTSVRPLDSVLGAEDTASVKSSEATVTQTAKMEITDKSEEREIRIPIKHQRSMSNLFVEDDAAIIIQTTFRRFMAQRQKEVMIAKDCEKKQSLGIESPSRESMGTSMEVQTSNSVQAFPIGRNSFSGNQRAHKKYRARILIKEDWDDSTVSSNISKMRVQNRLEAMTRRERALAYAFSQQLRICSKQKQSRHSERESSISWSWLERWMATRVPDSTPIESSTKDQQEMVMKQNHAIRKRLLDVAAVEEKESSGSNEVPVHFGKVPVKANEERPAVSRLQAIRNAPRCRKTGSSYQIQREHAKAKKTKHLQHESPRTKRTRNKQPYYQKEATKCKEASS